ncbi:MAG: M48 family metalloprotease [Actinomycetota bacterium]|nr:M48 family metalloprotease [Actinomycetota bacterium]
MAEAERPARSGPRGPQRTRPAPEGGALLSAHELADARNVERRRANARRLRVLELGAASAPAIVLGVVLGITEGVLAGAVAAAAVFLVVIFAVVAASMAFALRMVGGTPVDARALPGLVNQVEGLCATLGVVQPELRLLDDPVPNACALAGRAKRSVLVVTSGLVERLGLIEMEGVLAHELVHLKRHDAVVSCVAVATAGAVAWVTGRDGLVHLAVGRGREYGADQEAALAVRYPPGLLGALASMGEPPGGPASPFSGRRWAATRWIWIDPMVGATERAPIGELDATAVRAAALAEL